MKTPPKFPVGFQVKMGYLGLYRADETPTNRRGQPTAHDYRIYGIRLVPTGGEEEHPTEDKMIATVNYRKGWEYLIALLNADENVWDEDGWHTEAELLKQGYTPPETAADRLRAWKQRERQRQQEMDERTPIETEIAELYDDGLKGGENE